MVTAAPAHQWNTGPFAEDTPVLILQGPNHPVEALTFSRDSTALYAVQGHHGIRAWSIAERTATRAEAEGRLLVGQYAFHPGGRWAFSRTAHTRPPDYNGALAIDLATGAAHLFDCIGPRDTVAFRPDGDIVTVGQARYEHTGQVWHYFSRLCGWELTARGPHLAWQREAPAGENLMFVAGLGDRFATAEHLASQEVPTGRIDRVTVRRWSDGAPEAHLPFPHVPLQQLLAAADGSLLAARFGAEMRIWDATDWHRPPAVVRHSFWVESQAGAAAFHPSGRLLFLVTDAPAALAFDTTTWQLAQSWKWGAGRLQSVAVSPDGTLAAAGSASGATVVWDLDL